MTSRFHRVSMRMALTVSLALLVPAHNVLAQEATPTAAQTAVTPVAADPDKDTDPVLRLTPEKSEIVRLDREAKSLIVGNPHHLNILMDNNKTLVLVPREPGATHFIVLDDQGQVIMQRHVIIASPQENYIRIRRNCAGGQDAGCVATSMYYCPDMCHVVDISTDDKIQPAAQPSIAPAPATVTAAPAEQQPASDQPTKG